MPSKVFDMASLDLLDSIRLRAADNLLDGGNFREAKIELARMNPEARIHPDVIKRYWRVRFTESDWNECYRLAGLLRVKAPDEAFTWIAQARYWWKQGRLEEAYGLLKSKFGDFQRNWEVSYDLARYSCLLGKVEEALNWMTQAILLDRGSVIKADALGDPDFAALQKELARMNQESQCVST